MSNSTLVDFVLNYFHGRYRSMASLHYLSQSKSYRGRGFSFLPRSATEKWILNCVQPVLYTQQGRWELNEVPHPSSSHTTLTCTWLNWVTNVRTYLFRRRDLGILCNNSKKTSKKTYGQSFNTNRHLPPWRYYVTLRKS